VRQQQLVGDDPEKEMLLNSAHLVTRPLNLIDILIHSTMHASGCTKSLASRQVISPHELGDPLLWRNQ
jgi:hypothetical protein